MALAQSTIGRFSKILTESLGLAMTQVEPTANLRTDLGMDSLDDIELIMECEEEFDIEIPDEDVEFITTVEQAVAYLDQRMAAQTSKES